MNPTPSHRSVLKVRVSAHNAATADFVRQKLIGLVEMVIARDGLYRAEALVTAWAQPIHAQPDGDRQWVAVANVQLDHPDLSTVTRVADGLSLLLQVTHGGEGNDWTDTGLDIIAVHGLEGDALAPATVDGRARLSLPTLK